MNYFLCFGLAMMCYSLGLLLWNWRAFDLYEKRVSRPWMEAIDRWRGDVQGRAEVDYWREIGEHYRLQRLDILLNPIAWIRYWNWKPERYDAFDAGVKRWN